MAGCGCIRRQLIDALIEQGAKDLGPRVAPKQYVQLTLSQGSYYWVGKDGELRHGDTLKSSVDVSHRVEQIIQSQ